MPQHWAFYSIFSLFHCIVLTLSCPLWPCLFSSLNLTVFHVQNITSTFKELSTLFNSLFLIQAFPKMPFLLNWSFALVNRVSPWPCVLSQVSSCYSPRKVWTWTRSWPFQIHHHFVPKEEPLFLSVCLFSISMTHWLISFLYLIPVLN